MAKKPVLGDTLDSIFDDIDVSGESGAGLQTLRIGEIEPNREQPRKEFDPEKLEALAESIRRHGIIQPLTVRPMPERGGLPADGYQIVAGERRWRAARIAGLEEVPVRIMELTDSQTMQIALIENLQREDLNPVEEAQGYRELMDKFGMTQEQLAEVVGRARSSVTNSLRLLSLPGEVLDLAAKNLLSRGHCKAIMSAQSPTLQIELARRAAGGEISVRETERLARLTKESSQEAPGRKAPIKKTFFTETEIALGNLLNTKVRISDGKNKKILCIEFADEDELKALVGKFS